MASSLTSGSTSTIIRYFHVNKEYNPWSVLPTSIYLVGYLISNPIWAPLAEHYGRNPVFGGSFFFVLVWMMACALAPNWAAFLIFRFLLGFFTGEPEANIGGYCADLYGHRDTRGRAVAVYNVVSQWGRVLRPIVSGFATMIDWRWSFWFGLIYASVSWFTILWMPEVRHNVILTNRAMKLRKAAKGSPSNPNTNLYGPRELKHDDIWYIVRVVLLRPLRMFFVEPIVCATSLYLAFQYGLFYIFFQSYSIIYIDLYGFNEGEKGLTFLAIGVGVIITLPIQLLYERYYKSSVAAGKKWTSHHGAHRLPLAMLAGPLITLSLFWSGWTARLSIPWIVPTLSGLPFGTGYTLLFLSLLNYLVDACCEYAASAVAATTFIHGIFGVALPFAAAPEYDDLGIAWATSTLGFCAGALSLIPFAFWIWGETLLDRSRFSQELAGKKVGGRDDESVVGEDEKAQKRKGGNLSLGDELVMRYNSSR